MGRMRRFLTAAALSAIGVILSPETFGSSLEGQNTPMLLAFLKLAHLLCFSTAWGAAVWVTFIAAIIMFKNLPRRQFGDLQSKMFPAYFAMESTCCAVSVACFGYVHPWKSSSTSEKYQLGFLLSGLAFNLSNLLVFTPLTIEMMKRRHRLEREPQNVGGEVGIGKGNPQLAAVNKKFGMFHGLSSLCNILSFGSLAIHLWHLAGKISL